MSSEEATMSTDLTEEAIRDATVLLAKHYGEAVQQGRLKFYKRSERLMEVVAGELVAQQYLTHDLANAVVPKAVGFVQRGGRW
jgi:FKBP-type peptidyl-prolyl cis-trans isomerase (trigger factor)